MARKGRVLEIGTWKYYPKLMFCDDGSVIDDGKVARMVVDTKGIDFGRREAVEKWLRNVQEGGGLVGPKTLNAVIKRCKRIEDAEWFFEVGCNDWGILPNLAHSILSQYCARGMTDQTIHLLTTLHELGHHLTDPILACVLSLCRVKGFKSLAMDIVTRQAQHLDSAMVADAIYAIGDPEAASFLLAEEYPGHEKFTAFTAISSQRGDLSHLSLIPHPHPPHVVRCLRAMPPFPSLQYSLLMLPHNRTDPDIITAALSAATQLPLYPTLLPLCQYLVDISSEYTPLHTPLHASYILRLHRRMLDLKAAKATYAKYNTGPGSKAALTVAYQAVFKSYRDQKLRGYA